MPHLLFGTSKCSLSSVASIKLHTLGGGPVLDSSVGPFEAVKVDYVVDGDTLRVVDAQGAESYVRLIGIDASESVSADAAKNSPEGEAASDHLKALVPSGQTVYLTCDVSECDKYGRLLRYVWIERPISTADVEGKMLNAMLVSDGYAQAKRYPPDTAYAELLDRLAAQAEALGVGVSSKWN